MKKNKDDKPYYKEALNETSNIIGLAAIVALSATTFNPIPLILGAGLEALYMLFVPDSKFYKRYVDLRNKITKEKALENTEKFSKEQKIANLQKLDPDLIIRYKKLEKLHLEILERFRQTGKKTFELINPEQDKIIFLLSSYLNFLDTFGQYRNYLDKVHKHSIKNDINKLTREVFDMNFNKKVLKNEELIKLKQKNIDILNKRIERIAQMENTLANISVQLELIENTFHLINDQIVLLHSPTLPVDLNELVAGVENTERAIFETNNFLSKVSGLRERIN